MISVINLDCSFSSYPGESSLRYEDFESASCSHIQRGRFYFFIVKIVHQGISQSYICSSTLLSHIVYRVILTLWIHSPDVHLLAQDTVKNNVYVT